MSPLTTWIITGASKGFGRAIAIAAASAASAPAPLPKADEPDRHLRVFIVARSDDGLKETERLMMEANNSVKCNLEVSRYSMDLSDLDKLDANMETIFKDAQTSIDASKSATSEQPQIIFVSNAASIGFIGPVTDLPSLKEVQQSIDFNITSSLWQTSRFVKQFQTQGVLRVIQISSLVAVASFPTLSLYSTCKAARDRFHSVLAKEVSFKTLNYAPGPLETDMINEIRDTEALDETLRDSFQQKQLRPIDSAKKLIRIVQKDEYESGTHLDFYDVPDEENPETDTTGAARFINRGIE
uniref:Sepiapterin reductase n=1 Tax=Craspedostauros australis TaxID=1486917 RepID=A0A7R9WRZ6_9STRA|mmetsp:Transcript_15912/g.43986  ORF Transcript_15912/g.43986 Transcript_15912/m.43986 type:complete len:298 (+) Transcript_15912:110-1003(+)